MKTPSSVVDIIQEMVKVGVTIPITVKCRIGVDNLDSYEYLYDFVSLRLRWFITALSFMLRTLVLIYVSYSFLLLDQIGFNNDTCHSLCCPCQKVLAQGSFTKTEPKCPSTEIRSCSPGMWS